MSYDFPFSTAIDASRLLCKTIWVIPDGNPIAESGNNFINIPTFDILPVVLLEAEGEVEIQEGGEAGFSARDLVETFTYYFWLIEATLENRDDRQLVEQKIEDFIAALYADRSLNKMVTQLEIIEVDTTGAGRQFPGQNVPGTGVQYGYIGIRFTIADQ